MLSVHTEAEKMPKTFLRVANGNIIAKEGKDEIEFDTVTGMVTDIKLKDHRIGNKKFSNWHISMVDARLKNAYDLSFGRNSSVFRTIVRCLASDEGLASLNDIEIYVYRARYGNFTNAIVMGRGKKLSWIPEGVPPVMYCQINGMSVPDSTLRDEWLDKLVGRINDSARKTIPEEYRLYKDQEKASA